ncbi:hypothetical protein CONPUDRAFT_163903 [Coniophora puteana RWD-64-598 SS2]|uniref:peptidylprolyl isomerase n=1 Tax=Coniophora puteana (strain RWD-64-598) TaxID=741705 RepID=A0A5M3MVU4_CONPW|nr:uncharacterized protein CONPUDRAFT_163903 [Coniophora puteana RWD-64-598 SS2]EIW82835.1 hypothetical protein CONPUDRAFT_163903 [Coniophora puteana RWD-64-598 SS2]
MLGSIIRTGVFLLAITAAIAAEDNIKLPPNELKVDTTYLPSSCPQKTKSGDTIQVQYTGRLYHNDKVFDSSYDRGEPFEVMLGAGRVIRGWDLGLQDMCIHEKRTLTIPSYLAYGPRGYGAIPRNAALIFDVELVGLDSTPHDI